MSPKINVDTDHEATVHFPNSLGFGPEIEVDAVTLTRWANVTAAFWDIQREMAKRIEGAT